MCNIISVHCCPGWWLRGAMSPRPRRLHLSPSLSLKYFWSPLLSCLQQPGPHEAAAPRRPAPRARGCSRAQLPAGAGDQDQCRHPHQTQASPGRCLRSNKICLVCKMCGGSVSITPAAVSPRLRRRRPGPAGILISGLGGVVQQLGGRGQGCREPAKESSKLARPPAPTITHTQSHYTASTGDY